MSEQKNVLSEEMPEKAMLAELEFLQALDILEVDEDFEVLSDLEDVEAMAKEDGENE